MQNAIAWVIELPRDFVGVKIVCLMVVVLLVDEGAPVKRFERGAQWDCAIHSLSQLSCSTAIGRR